MYRRCTHLLSMQWLLLPQKQQSSPHIADHYISRQLSRTAWHRTHVCQQAIFFIICVDKFNLEFHLSLPGWEAADSTVFTSPLCCKSSLQDGKRVRHGLSQTLLSWIYPQFSNLTERRLKFCPNPIMSDWDWLWKAHKLQVNNSLGCSEEFTHAFLKLGPTTSLH